MDKLEIRRTLSRLIAKGEFENASEILRKEMLSPEWCHLAVSIYVFTDKIELAKQTVEWAKNNADRNEWRRCIYELARNYWKKVFGYSPEGFITFPGVDDNRKMQVEELLVIIKPILLRIEGDECVTNELEAKVLYIGINAYWIIGNMERVRVLAKFLDTKRPVSIELANLALMGVVNKEQLSCDFPNRLLEDYPESFNAKMLSYILQATLWGQASEAYTNIKSLAYVVKDEDRIRYCQGLFQVAQILGLDKIDDSINFIREMLGDDDIFCKLAEAESLLNKDKLSEAEDIICAYPNENDPFWLQLKALVEERKGGYENAIKYFKKASQLAVSPEIYASLGKLAIQACEQDKKYLKSVIGAFESLVKLKPDDISARHNLAFALLRAGKLNDAIEHLIYLSQNSENVTYLHNLGCCYAKLGETQNALNVFEDLCENDNVYADTIIAKSELLLQLKNPFQAFTFIKKYKERFWDDPVFIQKYMLLASQANNDDEMHYALVRLKEIQSEGSASHEIIQEASLDDILLHVKTWNERVRQIQIQYCNGKIPWILADSMMSHCVYTGWAIRTQKLQWLSEEPTVNANYTIYSTNSFHPIKSDDGIVRHMQIGSPENNIDVVFDMSALITLHRLGVMENIESFFGLKIIPLLYINKLSIDYSKMHFHQYSHVQSLREMNDAIICNSLSVQNPNDPNSPQSFFTVKEYLNQEEQTHYYSLTDLIQPLYNHGLIKEDDYIKLQNYGLRPSGIDHDHHEINLGDNVLIDLYSLCSTSNWGVLSTILQSYNVFLLENSFSQLRAEINTIDTQEEIRTWNKDLQDIIQSDFYTKVNIEIDSECREEFSLSAMSLALQENIPLVCDDRLVQSAFLNDSNGLTVFGTNNIIDALYSNGVIEIEEASKYYLKLMEWRYRFVIPPVEVLNHLAVQYSACPPGKDLRFVASYVHECMYDAGLFCGMEMTAEIPLPIGVKLFIKWLDIITEFMINCMTSDQLVDVSEQYVDWAIDYFIPATPKNLPDRGNSIAIIIKQTIMNQALVKLSGLGNWQQGNKIISKLKVRLQLSDVEYNRLVSEMINAI